MIKVNLSALRNPHESTGYHDHFTLQLAPRLQLVIGGVKNTKVQLFSKGYVSQLLFKLPQMTNITTDKNFVVFVYFDEPQKFS